MSIKRIHAYLLFLLVSFIWGAAAVVIKYTLQGINPTSFLTYRFFLSFIVAAIALSFVHPKIPKNPKIYFSIGIYSVFSTTIALGFLFFGLDKTTVLNLSIMTLAVPLLTEYAGVVFLKENITKQEKIGTAIAVLGTMFTIVEPILETGFNLGGFEGNFFILLYMIADITSVILLKLMLKKTVDPTELTHISFIIGFLTFVPFALLTVGADTILTDITALPFQYHLGVLYMAVISGTVAYALRAKAQKNIEVSEAALFAYLTPAISAPLALVFLKESISPIFIIGAILVIIGVSVAEFKKKQT